MARGTQLEQLIIMLRAETGHSTSPAAGVDNLPSLKQRLRRAQEMLYDDYDWPFLRVNPYKNLAAGDRYVDMPTELNPERIEDVSVWYGDRAVPLIRGVGPREYSVYNSDDDERSDPVQRWDIKSTGDTTTKTPQLEQVEVWPIPASAQQLQLTGIRKLRPLVAENDVCDLDDLAIVLTAGADMVPAKSPLAGKLEKAAAVRIRQVKGRQRGGATITTMGTIPPENQLRPGQSIVRISSSSS